jgi:Protein of unknown function (DUF3572)
MQQESAQVIALQALAWIAGDAEVMQSFMAATGADAGDIPLRAQEVDFQGAILDFILMDDDWVIRFCDAVGLAYTTPMAARMVLQGGEPMAWT